MFSASQAMHGGQESTLLTMAMPLLHHGMLLVGIPFTERALNQTRSGGTPYGATHVAGMAPQPAALSDDEIALAQVLGRRVADVAAALAAGRVARRV
jgi:NAD(P)H dehydrogenase (quinone)